MNNKLFEKICRMTQSELKKYLVNELKSRYGNKALQTTTAGGFIFAKGELPMLLVAHLDTVHKETPQKIIWDNETQTVSSPQGIGGDDRCGVYMILEIIKHYNCSVLFCEDEEIGGVGATSFIKNFDKVKELLQTELEFNYLLEFDRANAKDAVFYDCENFEFEDFITENFYKTSYGSYSDISTIAPYLGVAAANVSCGYYKAHTTQEYVVIPEMEASINAAMDILGKTDINVDKFEYIEASYNDFGYGYSDEESCYCIEYLENRWATEFATSEEEAIGMFLIHHPTLCYNDIINIEKDNFEEEQGC